jgi:hypothetical protein
MNEGDKMKARGEKKRTGREEEKETERRGKEKA